MSDRLRGIAAGQGLGPGRYNGGGRNKKPLRGGGGGIQEQLSSFNRTILKSVHNPWFNTKLSPLIKPVDNPTISPENLELLVSVFKMQFNLFREQLENFKKGGTFFIASSSTVDYKSSCDKIIAYLEDIITIMSSEEFISYFTTNCSGKSYEECIKSMSSYILMFPFIFDTDTSSWYLNYTYPFSVCLNEHILSLLENKPKDPENLDRIEKIIKFIRERKTSSSDSPTTPLEYGKNMPFNTAVTFVIMSECIKNGTQQQFLDQRKLYNEQSELLLTEPSSDNLRKFIEQQLLPLIRKDTNSDNTDGEQHDSGIVDLDKEK